MPVVLQRLIQKVKVDKWDALDAIDKKFDAAEAKFKYPPKRRYRSMIGPLDINVIIIEREWKSVAKMEEAMLASYGDPELQKLTAELNTIIEDAWSELYLVWPLKV